MQILYCVLIGYFIGCINPAYLLGKIKGKDVKKNGSGNAGASNALILFGKLAGVFCALFDIFKAWFSIWLAEFLFEAQINLGLSTFVITSIACILGHVFPFYTGFDGGKGLACFGGMVLRYSPFVFLLMLLGAVVLVIASNYICFVPMVASVVFPVVYGLGTKDLTGALLLGIIAVLMFFKHRENIKRIINGTEIRISFLWNKDKELERLNMPTEDEAEEVTETVN